MISFVITSKGLAPARHVTRMEEDRGAFKILTGKPLWTTSLGGPRRRWEDNLEWILKKLLPIRGIGIIQLRIWIIGSSL